MYTIPVQMFVQFMLQNDLIICAFRVNSHGKGFRNKG